MSRPIAGRWRALLVFTLLSGAAVGCTPGEPKRATITVAAASSLTGVMEEVAALWNERSPFQVRCTFGATSTLVRQVERGAPYEVLLSANRFWIEYLESIDAVAEADSFLLALNQLVVVAAPQVSVVSDFAMSLAAGRWALGDPDHVPAGVYAKAALEELHLWDDIEDRVVPAPSARAALRLVERGEVEFGIVYQTDLLGSDRATLVPGLPRRGTSIEVVASPLRSAGPEAREFARWLQSGEVADIFRLYGFEIPEAR